MPHGRLTRLAGQLRSVLANLVSRPPPDHKHHAPAPRSLHHRSLSRNQATAFLSIQPEDQRESSTAQDARRFRQHSWRRLKRRTRVDHISEALRDTGRHAAVPHPPPRKIDLNYVNPRSHNIVQRWRERKERHQHDPVPPSAESRELSLQRILASYIRHQARASDFLNAAWKTEFKLSVHEADFLRCKAITLPDVAAWADIISDGDTLAAAEKLARRADTLGPESIPTFIYLHLLRRDYMSAKALSVFVSCAFNLFSQRAQRLSSPGIDTQPVLLVVIRLLRHAREVWPQAMPSIAQLFLRHLQFQEQTYRPFNVRQVESVTFLLNKVMGLISYSTSLHPYRDNPYQEAAIVPILRYMAEHKPPMQIDRQGYRAVIRIQLAQRKTPNEQQWAELKALSWPPWKSDRTAMDASITLDYGVSKAGQTLARMRAAGFRMLNWEKTAQIYAGWDIDQTPTVQMRALLQQPGSRLFSGIFSDTYIPWVARINTTRTIQEAWACYLAWEDLKLSHDQDVYLAILGKLHGEEMRQRAGSTQQPSAMGKKNWPLLPGDTPRVSALPPSTHLYTYTRTVPPSMEDFYATLKSRGVVFEEHCLAFLVRHAPTLQSGLDRLRHSCQIYPELAHILTLDSAWDLSKVPLPVFRAAVDLYSRFAAVSMSRVAMEYRSKPLKQGSQVQLHNGHLNPNHAMARAISLLRTRPNAHPTVVDAVFQGLSKKLNLPRLKNLFMIRDHTRSDSLALRGPLKARHAGAIKAYAVMDEILSSLRKQGVQLGAVGFRALCVATENIALATWATVPDRISREDSSEESCALAVKHTPDCTFLREAPSTMDITGFRNLLKEEFRLLVSGHGSEAANQAIDRTGKEDSFMKDWFRVDLPRLLTIPNPAMLHVYIRALGWLADYDTLLDTIRWMSENRGELSERLSHDRLGEDMMRKAIVALRVFLERSWLVQGKRTAVPEVQLGDDTVAPQSLFQQLRAPAPLELVEAVKQVVDAVEEWGGWPSDEEVQDYVTDVSFQHFVEASPKS